MRRKFRDGQGRETMMVVTWSGHRDQCLKCQQVDLTRTATFVLACAEGSPLLMEHAVEMQRPVEKERQSEVIAWAKRAGVFKMPKGT